MVHTVKEEYGEEEIRIIPARKASSRERGLYEPLSDKERRELKKLARIAGSQIDYSAAPEIHIGRFYRPIKQLVSIRVDADVLACFRGRGKRYQTCMNEFYGARCRRGKRAAAHSDLIKFDLGQLALPFS